MALLRSLSVSWSAAAFALIASLGSARAVPPSFASVPRPRSVQTGGGATLTLGANTTISVSDEGLRPHALVLAQDLLYMAGIVATVEPGLLAPGQKQANSAAATIALVLNTTLTDSTNHFYEYRLDVTSTGVIATAGTTIAVTHATATLLQQLRPGATPGIASVSAVSVSDWSTVEWTGFMYDLARDPVDVQTMKGMIDLARFYKMRFLHIFATAEQGWRLPIPASATVAAPVSFEGLTCYMDNNASCRMWHSVEDRGGLNLTLTQISNGTWTITCPPGPNAVNFAGAEITPTVFYFDQQHFPSGAVGEVNYTSTDTTITITSHVNGVPCNLWWQIWVRPKVAPRPISLAGIAADGAAGCPLYKGEHWCNSTSVWAELGAYADARGVTLLGALEIVGHNSLPSEVFGDPIGLGCTNLASDLAIQGLKLLIDATLDTFPTMPILHIGWDEVGTDNVAKASTAPGFCKRHHLASCDEAHIVDHFLTDINDYVFNKTGGKVRLMAYENVNTPGTANRTVITQPWWINGGNGYMEDQIKTDVHGDTLQYEQMGLDTMQTAWKPRVYTRTKGVFDHGVGASVYSHPQGGGPAPPPAAAHCTISKGVKLNGPPANPDGPITVPDEGACCDLCAKTENCFAWSFSVNETLKKAGVTTCLWAHLTQCCWMHADDSLPTTNDPLFLASGTVDGRKHLSQNPKGFPIPINDHMLGAEMVLWETQRGQQDKVGFLRHKAPVLAENTYAFGNTEIGTSYYAHWAQSFATLDEKFSAFNSGFRLVEAGLSTDFGDILRTDTETSMDPVLAFDKNLTLTVIVNRPGTVVRYTNHTYTLDATGTKMANGDGAYATNASAIMPATLTFTPSSPELGEHSYLVIYAQAFDIATGERVGEPVVRRYFCQPFQVVVAGTLRQQDLSGMGSGRQFGPHIHEVTFFTEGAATVSLPAAPTDCSAHYATGGGNVSAASAALAAGFELVIRSSTDTISIACFDSNGRRVGRIWAAHFNSNLDHGIFGGNGSLAPANAITVEPIPSKTMFSFPLFDTPGNFTKSLREWLAEVGVVGIALNTSVKLTATVVGGGGAGSASAGGGAGGIGTEVYWDLLTCYPMTVEVGGPGEQSSVAFDDGSSGYNSPGPGRGSNQAKGAADDGGYPIRTTQDPIYPTIATPGGDGSAATPGVRGTVTKGDITHNAPATGTRGGAGWAGSDGVHGAGAGAGGDPGKPGAAGAVLIIVELLAGSEEADAR